MEKSVFVGFLGDYPLVKVLDFLIEFREFDYNKKDIARNSDVAWNTLEIFWPRLEKNGIVIKTRKVGKSQMYKLNMKNPAVQQLLKLDEILTSRAIRGKGTERKSVERQRVERKIAVKIR